MAERPKIVPLATCLHDKGGVRRCADCRVRLVSVCSVLDSSELQEIESIGEENQYVPRQALTHEGEAAESVFSITEGVVRVVRHLEDGKRQILGFALPSDFLGLSLTDNYRFTAEAITPAKACKFSRVKFASFADKYPHVVRRLYEMAGYELTLAREQLVLVGRLSADQRLAAFLISISNRLRRLGYTSPSIPLPMSRRDIADYLGLTIETVSRAFTRLAKSKLIVSTPDGVRLLKETELQILGKH